MLILLYLRSCLSLIKMNETLPAITGAPAGLLKPFEHQFLQHASMSLASKRKAYLAIHAMAATRASRLVASLICILTQ